MVIKSWEAVSKIHIHKSLHIDVFQMSNTLQTFGERLAGAGEDDLVQAI